MESKLYKIIRIDKYQELTPYGQTKVFHEFVDVLKNVSLDEVMLYLLHLDLIVDEKIRYRILSMNKKKGKKYNVSLSRCCGVNLVEFYECS